MAIPFTVPNQEVSQPNIQEILRELCEILQQLLIICRHQQSVPNNQQQATRNRAPSANPTNRQDPIPELISNLSMLTAAFNSRNQPSPMIGNSHQRVRRHRTSSESSCCDDAKTGATLSATTNEQADPQWIEVGMELRKIAADFKCAGFKDDKNQEESDPSSQSSSKSPSSSKRDSIFSKFVPAPFTGSICTAVICVVGWHLLRNR